MLLRTVENGEQFTITVRGKPIADLVPHRSQWAHSLKAAVRAMQAFPRIQAHGFKVSPMPTWPAS
jgi:antitoxin (DNA-binding transcriptional repressor) of toxin-antitoxin stability system